jgi:hypothetical protein
MRLSEPSHARKRQAECLQLRDDEDLKSLWNWIGGLKL